MASRVRDNNEVFKSSIEKNLSALFDCVKGLKTNFDDTQFPIDDDNIMLHRLGDRLEFLLCVGLRQSSGVFSRSKSPWHYINSCLSKLKNNHDGIRFVRGLSELKTPTGKLRSFLRFCLVHQCLADTLQQCTLCEDVTSEYYSANSLFSKQTWKSSFISSLYELNDIQYDLAPTGYDLDVGWPTFARKQFGSFNWSRQQRSSSRLSLSLLSESQSVNSFRSELTSPLSTGPLNSTMASSVQSNSPSPPPPDAHEMDRLIATIRQITEDKEELQIQLDSLSRQLGEERENGKKDREQMEEERRQYQENSAEMDRRLELTQKQVSPQTLESLRQAEALGRKMLAVRDGEVELLKAQLVSTEAKVDALKERQELQKVVIMGEVRKMANQLAATEFQLKKWKELATNWSQMEHADDVKLESIKELDGAEELGKKLKELFSSQQTAIKELESIKEANMSLARALAQHDHQLSTVTNQLDQTWVWFSKLKTQASQLQTDESVMRYDLKEKRKLLNSLKEQLEVSKQQWERIRNQNDANQEEWQSFRDELDGRKVAGAASVVQNQVEEEEEEEKEDAAAAKEREPPAFVPPIDLVSDIVPNQVVHDDDELPVPESSASADGRREERLQLMEQQCRSLYAKLVNSTSRNAALVSRLANLHQHYSIKEEQPPSSPTASTAPEMLVETVADQGKDAEEVIQEKDRQLAVVQEELKAIKFDQATRQLEKEKENQAYQQQEEQLKLALSQLAENGQLIGSLQLQLSTLTGRNQEERQLLDNQFRQMQLSLMTRNEECEGLVNEIRSTVAEMDQLRTLYLELQEKFKCCQEAESQAKSDNQILREESLMLRDKIVQLIKEKDCLWQRSDRLLHLQRIQATDQWLADGSIRDCQSCQSRFTIFVRRHHCRLCGRIFCHSCSDYWLKIASSARPTRTCHECFAIHRQFSQPGATGQLSELPVTDPSDGKDLTTEPVVVQSQQQQCEGGSLAEPCAGFSVISDDEIVQSLNDSSPYSSPRNGPINENIRTAAVRSFSSLVHDESNETNPSEAFVSAGMIYRIPFQVERPGCVFHWKFKTDPRSIAFAIVGAEDDSENDESLTRIIVETALHKSEEDFVQGQAELPLSGRYYVYFDNSYSRFNTNKITFHLSLTAPSFPI
ncbi:FYVE and coiled-coil domain-containing protein 1-like isoform X2 [Daphnia pulicaria]|uniref:FYVE and coiled-coil domain-containing protein 1-like isoform X2 n=1 Tax=Daphnia pulicaria TaxID=35523 RepID=UPI001EEBE4CF|nr:FYVE and coiled-coil domain-containing protein 1-like isoform X2 [Daphnia pulicaria]